MSEPLPPELEARAQELAARFRTRSADTILEMARLVATTDDTLFGDTEFALRDSALGLIPRAYAEHLPTQPAARAISPCRVEQTSQGSDRASRESLAGRSCRKAYPTPRPRFTPNCVSPN